MKSHLFTLFELKISPQFIEALNKAAEHDRAQAEASPHALKHKHEALIERARLEDADAELVRQVMRYTRLARANEHDQKCAYIAAAQTARTGRLEFDALRSLAETCPPLILAAHKLYDDMRHAGPLTTADLRRTTFDRLAARPLIRPELHALAAALKSWIDANSIDD